MDSNSDCGCVGLLDLWVYVGGRGMIGDFVADMVSCLIKGVLLYGFFHLAFHAIRLYRIKKKGRF